MSIPPPNYTQTPNAIFDLITEMKEAEIRVTMAIVRETFGWHRESKRLSITDLQRLTKLSRQGVINGVDAGMSRGTITRERDGDSYRYGLDIHEVDTSNQLVNQIDYQTIVSSQRSRPTLVNEVDQQNTLFQVVEEPPKESSKESNNSKEILPSEVEATLPAETKPKHRQSTAYTNPTTGINTNDIMGAYKNLLLKHEPGASFVYSQAAAAAKALAELGWSPSQVTECYEDMRKDPWWKGKAISLQSVAKKIGAYHERNKRPVQPTLTLEAQGIFLDPRPIRADEINF